MRFDFPPKKHQAWDGRCLSSFLKWCPIEVPNPYKIRCSKPINTTFQFLQSVKSSSPTPCILSGGQSTIWRTSPMGKISTPRQKKHKDIPPKFGKASCWTTCYDLKTNPNIQQLGVFYPSSTGRFFRWGLKLQGQMWMIVRETQGAVYVCDLFRKGNRTWDLWKDWNWLNKSFFFFFFFLLFVCFVSFRFVLFCLVAPF